ncbi:MAG: helix-turn-helix transcriptional regulator, partial [Schwartzia sp.]|nr:helix-turn-helix transcriptional regulator [Schwartzia sp. (in: firmicutes)]
GHFSMPDLREGLPAPLAEQKEEGRVLLGVRGSELQDVLAGQGRQACIVEKIMGGRSMFSFQESVKVKLRLLRMTHNLSTTQLAELLGFKSNGSIGQIETGL